MWRPSSASSSTDTKSKDKYDVFLSFRGPDTRKTLTSHLKKALDGQRMDTFIDYDLERGEEITPSLLKAIERSVVSLIVFSKNYASSRWCLDELVHILECKEKYKRHVIPIFYNTLVSDIRHQTGSYEIDESFKDRSKSEQSKWKDALRIAANLSGFESSKFRDDAELIEKVVQYTINIVNSNHQSSSHKFRLNGLGIRVREIVYELFPRDDRVRFLVIWGKEGVGKTTLADHVFHYLSMQFDGCCFLGDIRNSSGTQKQLRELRNKLVRDLVGDTTLDIQSKTIDRSVAEKLRRRRVLVVLDDVDKSSQLEILVGPDITFGSGSRIIITTRHMKEVSEIEALHLGGSRDVARYELCNLVPFSNPIISAVPAALLGIIKHIFSDQINMSKFNIRAGRALDMSKFYWVVTPDKSARLVSRRHHTIIGDTE